MGYSGVGNGVGVGLIDCNGFIIVLGANLALGSSGWGNVCVLHGSGCR